GVESRLRLVSTPLRPVSAAGRAIPHGSAVGRSVGDAGPRRQESVLLRYFVCLRIFAFFGPATPAHHRYADVVGARTGWALDGSLPLHTIRPAQVLGGRHRAPLPAQLQYLVLGLGLSRARPSISFPRCQCLTLPQRVVVSVLYPAPDDH